MNDMLSETASRAVEEILARELDVQREQLVPEARLMDDLGAGSLTLVEITMAVQERFNLSIPDERWERVRTVGEPFEALAERLQEQHY